MNRETIAKIICESSLWNCGKDSHNALSELTESIYGLLDQVLDEVERKIVNAMGGSLIFRLTKDQKKGVKIVMIVLNQILSDLRKDNGGDK